MKSFIANTIEDEEIVLRQPALSDEAAITQYVADVCVHGVAFHGAGGLDKMKSVSEWLDVLEADRKLEYTGYDGEGKVPGFTMCSFRKSDGKMIGTVNLRPQLNKTLDERLGGHVGYDVAPSEFGKGYGTRQITLVKRIFISNGFDKIRVGCNSYNLGSKRIIEKAGGQLIAKEDGIITWLYYEIVLKA